MSEKAVDYIVHNKLSDLNETNYCENRKRSRTSFEVVDFRIAQKIVNIQIELQEIEVLQIKCS